MIPRPVTAALLVCAALVATGCGEKSEEEGRTASTQELDLVLDYFPNADHAGIYAAIGNGDFERAGLSVTPRTPSDPSAPLKLLAAGRADLVISYEPELLLARDKGQELQAVGALVQKPLTSLISIGKDAIEKPEDLRNTRVGTAGIPYQSAYLKTILREANVPESSVREINVGFNLTPAMLSGRVDATLGSFWNYEGVELERRNRNPTILRMEDLGVPTYNELIVVARAETVRNEGPMLRRFMQALAAGHQALKEDPAQGIDPLLEANPDLQRGLQTAVVDATLPVFFPEDEDRPFGYMDPKEWAAYTTWMVDEELIGSTTPGARAFTNEFLPGEGLGEGEAAP
ncbi:MAG: ABC transporter substrate-binding protein [Solirubrobacteraceae bacterium]|nr:ABC transporter substrate-binding protein [Solirubrobacteraceae bacterium]